MSKNDGLAEVRKSQFGWQVIINHFEGEPEIWNKFATEHEAIEEVFDDSFEKRYQNLFREVFSALPPGAIHSVTLGVFRMPKRFFHLIKMSTTSLLPNPPILG